MAGPAQALKVVVVVCAAMCLGLDVVNRGRRYRATVAFAHLTQMLVAPEDNRPQLVPAHTIATLVPALAVLMGIPSYVDVVRAVA